MFLSREIDIKLCQNYTKTYSNSKVIDYQDQALNNIHTKYPNSNIGYQDQALNNIHTKYPNSNIGYQDQALNNIHPKYPNSNCLVYLLTLHMKG